MDLPEAGNFLSLRVHDLDVRVLTDTEELAAGLEFKLHDGRVEAHSDLFFAFCEFICSIFVQFNLIEVSFLVFATYSNSVDLVSTNREDLVTEIDRFFLLLQFGACCEDLKHRIIGSGHDLTTQEGREG